MCGRSGCTRCEACVGEVVAQGVRNVWEKSRGTER